MTPKKRGFSIFDSVALPLMLYILAAIVAILILLLCQVETGILIAAEVGVLVLGIVLVLVVTNRMSGTMNRLSRELAVREPGEDLSFPETGLTELDDLVRAVAHESRSASINERRIAGMLALVGSQVGIYELRQDRDEAYCSRGVYELLGRPRAEWQDTTLPMADCEALLREALTDEVYPSTYRIMTPEGARYVRRATLRQKWGLIGTLADVTTDTQGRIQFEYELQHDSLTGLMNRKAFTEAAQSVLHGERKVKNAVVVMMDLDNLKYINDTYGHAAGDRYIMACAEALRGVNTPQTLIARRSGDEFLSMAWSYDWDRAELEEEIQRRWAASMNITCDLGNGIAYRMRVSGVMAWLHDDAETLGELERFADFAMYTVKRGEKGRLRSFDRALYREEGFLLDGQELLDHLLEKQDVYYVFQPVLRCEDGSAYGYELLMRPRTQGMQDMDKVLRLARARGLLHDVEYMTWNRALESAEKELRDGKLTAAQHVFVNSIADQLLTEQEWAHIQERYAALLPRVVVEITDTDQCSISRLHRKVDFFHQIGAQVALGDYGAGYNNDLLLMACDWDCVKLDINIVRNVNGDRGRQTLVQNLMRYAAVKGTRVLCEGVENREDMEQLASFHVNYMQCYYFGRPMDVPAPIPQRICDEVRACLSQEARA